jgi:hypothetical protein
MIRDKHTAVPPRWREQDDSPNPLDRAAGEAVRAFHHEPLTSVQVSRIAARIRTAPSHRRHRLIPAVVALLLGIATAASATHLDLLPRWLGGQPRSVTTLPHDSPSVLRGRKARAPFPGQLPAPTGAPSPVPSSPYEGAAAGSRPEGPAELVPTAPVPGAAVAPAARKSGPRAPDRASPSAHEAFLPAASALPAPVESTPSPAVPTIAPPPTVAPAPGTKLAYVHRVRSLPAMPAAEHHGRVWEPSEGSHHDGAPSTSPAPVAPAARPEVVPPATSKGRGGPTKPLTKAIHALRIERDATSALALLDRHRGEFAQQGLSHEALILRVEALLELGRDREALRLLDGAALSDVDASHSLLVTRGRLRAAANRCADGMGDFNLVLAESRLPERQALFGRALCRKQLGDSAGAAADLERYRREFPTDPQLVELERWLSGAK